MTSPVRQWLLLMLTSSWLAFANVDVGSPLPNPELTTLEGSSRRLLAEGKTEVFIFFNPAQENSVATLRALARLHGAMRDRPVEWVAVASDRFEASAVKGALLAAGLSFPTVVDAGDALYGELGVRLYPSLGIADTKGNLAAYLPYTKVDYVAKVRAHLLHTLGELDDAGLQAALAPGAVDRGGDDAVAHSNLNLARMLIKSGKTDKALERAQEAVRVAPDLAEAHALVGAILAQQGKCDEALPILARALELNPEEPTATEAQGRCP